MKICRSPTPAAGPRQPSAGAHRPARQRHRPAAAPARCRGPRRRRGDLDELERYRGAALLPGRSVVPKTTAVRPRARGRPGAARPSSCPGPDPSGRDSPAPAPSAAGSASSRLPRYRRHASPLLAEAFELGGELFGGAAHPTLQAPADELAQPAMRQGAVEGLRPPRAAPDGARCSAAPARPGTGPAPADSAGRKARAADRDTAAAATAGPEASPTSAGRNATASQRPTASASRVGLVAVQS